MKDYIASEQDYDEIGLSIADLADLEAEEQDDLFDLVRDFGPDEDWEE